MVMEISHSPLLLTNYCLRFWEKDVEKIKVQYKLTASYCLKKKHNTQIRVKTKDKTEADVFFGFVRDEVLFTLRLMFGAQICCAKQIHLNE